MRGETTRPIPKYQQVYDTLRRQIVSGQLAPGARVPSEARLVEEFGASRITVGRALRDLQRAGLIDRKAGSGTFVRSSTQPAAARTRSLLFGLLIPDLGDTEIFEPVCQGIAGAPAARSHAIIWGSVTGSSRDKAAAAWDVTRQYIDRRVAGVFFAPLESVPDSDAVNRRITDALDEAGIPVVLLDRPVVPYGRREGHDLVGIDNRRAGYRITEHVLGAGASRVAFVAPSHAAATVDARLAGYRDALLAAGAAMEPGLVLRLDAAVAALDAFVTRERPDAIVCANDRTAGIVMQRLLHLGYAIPRDIRLVGIDDVRYAKLLPVPLTTLHQPCREIGLAAMTAMLDRVADPALPPRDIFLHPTLVVRQSCGTATPRRPSPDEKLVSAS